MKSTSSFLKSQYELVQQSRKVLFDYCEKISEKEFVAENTAFGRGGSIRNLLIHIANTYEFWIVKNALKKEKIFTEYSSKSTIKEIRPLFDSIDVEVYEFISRLKSLELDQIQFEFNGTKQITTPLELFTHAITHEFHHKGQILTLSRHLGYVPVDTDVMR